MADLLTLRVVSAAALQDGIGFLYERAGDALKRWRDWKTSGKSSAAEQVDVQLPSNVFAGQLERPQLCLEIVGRLEQELRDLRAAVAEYAQGIDVADPNDDGLLQAVDALRRAMEVVYGQRITFVGESRSPSGPFAAGEVNVDEVLGYVTGLRAGVITGGSVSSRPSTTEVASGGQVTGVQIGNLGVQVGDTSNINYPFDSPAGAGDPDLDL